MSNPTSRTTRQVLVNGIPLAGEVGVMAFSIMQYYNKITSAKLKIQDGSVANRDFIQSNSELFKPGNELELQLGYDDSPTTVFKGIIIRHSIKVKGSSYLEIEAKDKAVKLTTVRKSAYFINKKDSEIIEEIVGNNLEKDIEASTDPPHAEMIQYYSSDWDFIVMRAEANGMFVLTDKGKIIVKKPSLLGISVLTATYGDNVIEFEGEMDARRQYSSVSSKAWHFNDDPQAVVSKTGSSTLTETGNLASATLANVLGSNLELKHSGNLSDAQLSQWANTYSLRNHLSKACGRVRIRGNENLKPGQKITLAGVGNRFNGQVIITGILHQFDGDFTTDIQFGWAEEWFFKKEDIIEKPASGLVPGVTGLQIATVKQIHGPPSGKENHIKINLSMINDSNDDGFWARVALLDAGQGRGFIFRPEINDEVIVGFINDDPRDAVILGMLHSQTKAPPSFLAAEQSNPKKGIVTKNGLKITFDDTNKVLTIAVPVSTSTEKAIVINNQTGSIEIKDEFQNLIKMSSDGIVIKSPKKVVIQGTEKIDLNPMPPIP